MKIFIATAAADKLDVALARMKQLDEMGMPGDAAFVEVFGFEPKGDVGNYSAKHRHYEDNDDTWQFQDKREKVPLIKAAHYSNSYGEPILFTKNLTERARSSLGISSSKQGYVVLNYLGGPDGATDVSFFSSYESALAEFIKRNK